MRVRSSVPQVANVPAASCMLIANAWEKDLSMKKRKHEREGGMKEINSNPWCNCCCNCLKSVGSHFLGAFI